MSFSPPEVYSRCLLGAYGYPLWIPEPHNELSEDYRREGLRIGDVGVVSPVDGSFDVLFNITLPLDRQPYPQLVQEGLKPVILDQGDLATKDDAVSPHSVVSSPSVELVSQDIHSCNQKPSRADYEFSLSTEDDGAVLILPEGAQSCVLRNEQRFLDEAIQHGVDWYEWATKKAGRLIDNGSLYLITEFHKARSWSLGAVGRSGSSLQNRRCVKFKVGQIHQDSVPAGAYLWVLRTHGFMGRVGPRTVHSHDPIPHPNFDTRVRHPVNQTVFIRGFRITVNKILLLNLKTVSVETQHGTFSTGFWTHLASHLFGGASESTSSSTGGTDPAADQDFSGNWDPLHMDSSITIDRVPDVSQTFHPGDSINQYMLKKAPRAMVAITHDRVWIEMLRMGLLELADFSREERLQEVLSKNYQMITESGAVYIQKGYTFESPLPLPDTATRTDEHEETIITNVKATDVAPALRRVPAGFHQPIMPSAPVHCQTVPANAQDVPQAPRKPPYPQSVVYNRKGNSSPATAGRIESHAVEIDVIFVGQTGVGKSSLINMILDAPDGSGAVAKVSNDAHPCTTHTISYSTSLDTDLRCLLWDTRGFDEAVGTQSSFMVKLVDRIRQSQQARELKETLRDRTKLATSILMCCIDATKIDVEAHWQQFHKVYVEYCERRAIPVVVITRGPPKATQWETRCTNQIRRLDLGVDVPFRMVRRYRSPSSPEYEEDTKALKDLISELTRR